MTTKISFPNERELHDVMSTSEIYLRWAKRSDIPAIAKILTTNLLSFEFFDHFAPTRTQQKEEFYVWVLNRVRMFFTRPGVRFMVAERLLLQVSGQQDSQVIGFTAWQALGDNPLAREWHHRDSSWSKTLESKLVNLELLHHKYLRNTVVDYRAFAHLWNLLHQSCDRIERLRSNLHLQYIMVDPAWQRGRNIGRRLLQWGLDVADQLGLPVVLESSLAGYPFYLKHGFQVLNMVRIDVDPRRAYDMPVLVYVPKGSETLALTELKP